jgi:hypothetical protein
MAACVLNRGEKACLESPVSKVNIDGQDTAFKGTLLATESRIVFVTQQGMLNKKYDIAHCYPYRLISNIRVEKRMFGSALAVDAMFDSGKMTIRYEGIANPQDWVFHAQEKAEVDDTVDLMTGKIITLVNSKEKTKFSEINQVVITVAEFKYADSEISEFLGCLIDSGAVEGFVDEENKEFIHMTAYKQKKEVVHYNIAASFNFNTNGALEIKCPNCGASQELKEKQSKIVCNHCGKNYIVPDKMLKLI